MNITFKKLLSFTFLFLIVFSSQGANLTANTSTFADVYANAADGDVILLDEGTYTTAVAFPSAKALTLKGNPSAATQPVLNFQLTEPAGAGGSLTFDGLVIDRQGGDYFYNSAAAISMNAWKFVKCTIKNVKRSFYYNSNKATASNINSISFDRCLVTACGTTKESFLYVSQTVGTLSVTNSTFYNMVGGDFFKANNTLANATANISASFINNTMYKCILDKGYGWMSINNVYPAGNTYLFRNNIFDTGANADPATNMPILIYKGNVAPGTSTEENNIVISYGANNGTAVTASNLTLGSGVLAAYSSIPYQDAANGNFILPKDSPFATAGVGGAPVGDPRWLNNGVLPITGLELKATTSSRGIDLSWTTRSENSTSYFVVERSEDGLTFKTLAQIKANGNTQSLSRYSFTDNASLNGDAYYKIQAIDFDGKYAYSNVVFVSGLSQSGLSVYPTVASSSITIVHPKATDNSSIGIFNLNGQKVINVPADNTQNTVDVSGLSAGLYIIKYSDGAKALNTKFVKQ